MHNTVLVVLLNIQITIHISYITVCYFSYITVVINCFHTNINALLWFSKYMLGNTYVADDLFGAHYIGKNVVIYLEYYIFL